MDLKEKIEREMMVDGHMNRIIDQCIEDIRAGKYKSLANVNDLTLRLMIIKIYDELKEEYI